MHPTLVPPDSIEGYDERESYAWKTEYDVVSTLRASGHEVRPLGVQDELQPIRNVVDDWKPHIVFNLLEEFHGLAEFDQHVVSFLELLRVPYTGCNPRGLVLARGKSLSKKLLSYHRLLVPAFAVFRRGERGRLRRGLSYPVIVKSLTEEASLGISQASIVENDEKLEDRVRFVHESIGTAAIAEQFIEGRELTVSMLGNQRVEIFPVWELLFEKLPPGHAPIATAKVKHDPQLQEKWGIFQQPAGGMTAEMERSILRTSRRIYRILELDGYARIDYRLTSDGRFYFLEANPNPEVAQSQEFASAAEAAGIDYPDLLQKIVSLGIRRSTGAR